GGAVGVCGLLISYKRSGTAGEGGTGMRRGKSRGSGGEPITASEIAAFVYCPEQWRLEHGLGLEPGNRAARDAGTRPHAHKAVAERVAGLAIGLGRVLVVRGGAALRHRRLRRWIAAQGREHR